MLKKVLVWVFAAIGFIVVIVAGQVGKEVGKSAGNAAVPVQVQPTEQQIDVAMMKDLSKAAAEINKKGAVMQDENSRMDGATVGPGRRLTYNFSLVNFLASDLEPNWLRQIQAPLLKSRVCGNKAMVSSMRYGVVYAYSYRDKGGLPIGVVEIKPSDCGINN